MSYVLIQALSGRVVELNARIAELEAERDRLKGQLCEWCAQGAPRDELVSDKHRIPSHSGHGWEYPACGLFRSPGARITELETERDRLQARVAHLDKLADLYPISLGNACEDRDKLKHSDRALRAENAALRKALEEIAATADAPVTDAIGPLYGAGIYAGVKHCARIARDAVTPRPQTDG